MYPRRACRCLSAVHMGVARSGSRTVGGATEINLNWSRPLRTRPRASDCALVGGSPSGSRIVSLPTAGYPGGATVKEMT